MALTCCENHVWQRQEIIPSYLSKSESAFIAQNNDSIYIFGGVLTDTDFIEYNTISGVFINHPNNYDFGRQDGQSSVQIGYELYMLPYNNNNIIKLNLNTLNTETVTQFPGFSTEGRCVTHLNSHLIVIGGRSPYTGDMHVYDMAYDIWSTGAALPSKRAWHTCNTAGQTIYVMGGYYR
eukprot:326213_1